MGTIYLLGSNVPLWQEHRALGCVVSILYLAFFSYLYTSTSLVAGVVGASGGSMELRLVRQRHENYSDTKLLTYSLLLIAVFFLVISCFINYYGYFS